MNTTPTSPSSKSQILAEPTLVRCRRQDGKIVPETAMPDIRRLVSEGRIVVLKDVFAPELMLEYRNALVRWSQETEMFPHGQSPSAFPEMNYHRIDDGTIQGVCPHIFHQFGFNTVKDLPDYIGRPSQRIAEDMASLQNGIAGTNFELSVTGLRLKVIHYPSGAGFLAQHTHPLEPQRIGLIASLSRLGEDVKTGAACFQTPSGRVDTTLYHDIGDVIVFRYDLPHEVTLSDEGETLDWKSSAGKWSVVLELRDTHARSHGRPPGAG
jgi:hypothetical protein